MYGIPPYPQVLSDKGERSPILFTKHNALLKLHGISIPRKKGFNGRQRGTFGSGSDIVVLVEDLPTKGAFRKKFRNTCQILDRMARTELMVCRLVPLVSHQTLMIPRT